MKQAFVIERGIPAPIKPGCRKPRMPLEKLNVGDSIVAKLNGRKSWAFVFKEMNDAQNLHGFRLTSRLITPGKRRIWRVG